MAVLARTLQVKTARDKDIQAKATLEAATEMDPLQVKYEERLSNLKLKMEHKQNELSTAQATIKKL